MTRGGRCRVGPSLLTAPAYAGLSAEARRAPGVGEDLADGPAPEQVLDVFSEAQAGGPLHVFLHGGCWQALSQKEPAMMAGVRLAVLNDALAPQARLGVMVGECRAALLRLAGQAAALAAAACGSAGRP